MEGIQSRTIKIMVPESWQNYLKLEVRMQCRRNILFTCTVPRWADILLFSEHFKGTYHYHISLGAFDLVLGPSLSLLKIKNTSRNGPGWFYSFIRCKVQVSTKRKHGECRVEIYRGLLLELASCEIYPKLLTWWNLRPNQSVELTMGHIVQCFMLRRVLVVVLFM